MDREVTLDEQLKWLSAATVRWDVIGPEGAKTASALYDTVRKLRRIETAAKRVVGHYLARDYRDADDDGRFALDVLRCACGGYPDPVRAAFDESPS